MSGRRRGSKRRTLTDGQSRRKSARLSPEVANLNKANNMAPNSRELVQDVSDINGLMKTQKTHCQFDFKQPQFPKVVDLNVGGRHFTTSLATLTKYPDSMLAAMFSGRHHVTQDKDERYFIDVDGDLFSHLLNFLRLETLPSPEKVNEVKKYAEYFGIEELTKRLNDLEPSSEDSLFAIWASDIENYSKYLNHLRNELTDCEILGGYVYVQLSQKSCLSPTCSHTIDLINYVNTDYAKRRCSIIDIPVDELDSRRMKMLLTVLAHDIRRIGFYVFTLEEPLTCPCKLAKKFKVDACIEKYDVRRFFV